MGDSLPDIEDARLQLSHCHGEIQSLEGVVRHLKEKAGKAFVDSKESEARLLKSLAGGYYQDIEVLEVKRTKFANALHVLEAKEENE